MNDAYAKMFRTMYTGSMYGAGIHVFAVWGWVLAHKDENGQVEVNPRLVASELGAEVEQVERAIEYLTAPDPDSRSPEEEGRRMIRVSQFGYRVVNHEKYQDRGRDRTAYWRRYRERKKSATVAQPSAPVAQPKNTHVDGDVAVNENIDVKGKRKKGTFVPPTPAEVDSYAKSIGYIRPNLGRDFCQKYDALHWCHKDGKPMTNWKLTLQEWRRRDEQNPKRSPAQPVESVAPPVRGADGLTPRERLLQHEAR
jgi:hypothetical protein